MSQADELRKLQELFDRGTLTADEYAQAKANVLAGGSAGDGDAQRFLSHPEPASPRQVNQWAMFLHFSQFAGYLVPLAGLIAPIVLWQLKKDDWPEIDAHGKNVLNWIISLLIYAVVCIPLIFLIIGIPLLIALGVMGVVFPIIGGLKANNGEVWRYPLSITFLS